MVIVINIMMIMVIVIIYDDGYNVQSYNQDIIEEEWRLCLNRIICFAAVIFFTSYIGIKSVENVMINMIMIVIVNCDRYFAYITSMVCHIITFE